MNAGWSSAAGGTAQRVTLHGSLHATCTIELSVTRDGKVMHYLYRLCRHTRARHTQKLVTWSTAQLPAQTDSITRTFHRHAFFLEHRNALLE